MLTFTQFITEQAENNYDFKTLFQTVKEKAGFKGGFYFYPGINANTMSVKMAYAGENDTKTTLNNDALDVTLRVTVDAAAFTVEFLDFTAKIKPSTPNRIFGRHKFAARKMTAKTEADVIKKLVKFVQSVMDDTKQLLSDGKFEVYNGSAKVYDDAYIDVIRRAVNA